MNKDLHYYGTYLAARIADFEHEEAIKIAYAAQYVDESNIDMIDGALEGLLGKSPQPTVTTPNESFWYDIKPTQWMGWTNDQLTRLQKIWMAFHFLPGNFNDRIEYKGTDTTGNTKTLFKLLCTTNSATVEAMINDTQYNNIDEKPNQNTDLHMIGLRMHVLADTWSHQYYIGTPLKGINDVNGSVDDVVSGKVLSFNPIQSLLIMAGMAEDDPWNETYVCTPGGPSAYSISYLGHGRMGHLPDYPFLHYKYHPSWKGANYNADNTIQEKNNPEDYINAFHQMIYALKCIKNGWHFSADYLPIMMHSDPYYKDMKGFQRATDWLTREMKLKDTIDSRVIDQSDKWDDLINELYDTKIGPYNPNSWKELYMPPENSPVPPPDIRRTTDYYLFNKAAVDHVTFVERFLQNKASTGYIFSLDASKVVTERVD